MNIFDVVGNVLVVAGVIIVVMLLQSRIVQESIKIGLDNGCPALICIENSSGAQFSNNTITK